ncbi:hypothetical protein AN958_06452 [Leucoagaricus sp. SymC.cos]|nr:hypothetical protein AN958_06452 [Leucoagaricus sp. SymC.cos]
MSTSPTKVSSKRKLTIEDEIPNKRKQLRIEIPSTTPASTTFTSSTTAQSHSSLFSSSSLFNDASDNFTSPANMTITRPAMTTAPSIPGLYFIPSIEIPSDLAESVTSFCMSTYFNDPNVNQIMLFTRFTPDSPSSLPSILLDLLDTLSTLLYTQLPHETHSLLFPDNPTQARQVILNLYTPGEGISPHVDLLKRFGDGIIGVSLGSGCVMRFTRASPSEIGGGGASRISILDDPVIPSEISQINQPKPGMAMDDEDAYELYLPERSVLVLSSDARYKWTHGIEKRKSDFIANTPSHCRASLPIASTNLDGHWVDRGIRLSVTFRWLLPGADIMGGDDESESDTSCTV